MGNVNKHRKSKEKEKIEILDSRLKKYIIHVVSRIFK